MRERIIETTVWNKLKDETRPVILYGMGNGADMIIEKFYEYGINFSDIFASDNFVRGHSFHGKKVLKYSDICEKYDDFVIVMTFALQRKEDLENVLKISEEHTLLSLTVPVAGEGLFTREFFDENADKFEAVYNLLSDEKSKETFINIINFKISGKIKYLFSSFSPKKEVYENILNLNENDVIIDLGAYNGDTVKEFIENSHGYPKKITALEPDKKNFAKLLKNTSHLDFVECLNLGAWSKDDILFFRKTAGRQSKLDITGEEIPVKAIDSLIKEKITLLKMDIEGSELEAITGAEKTIKKYSPKLYVCAYHRNEDMFALPLKIHSINPNYRFYFRQHPYIPAWESNFYAKEP